MAGYLPITQRERGPPGRFLPLAARCEDRQRRGPPILWQVLFVFHAIRAAWVGYKKIREVR